MSSGPPPPPPGQDPVFYHTPVKPTRQPSRIAAHRPGGASAPAHSGYGSPALPQSPVAYQPRTDYNHADPYLQQQHANAAYAHEQAADFQSTAAPTSRRPLNLTNPHDAPPYNSHSEYATAHSPQSAGLRQRSGDSISRNHGGGVAAGSTQVYANAYDDGGLASSTSLAPHNGVPYGANPEAAHSTPSLYSQTYDERAYPPQQQDWKQGGAATAYPYSPQHHQQQQSLGSGKAYYDNNDSMPDQSGFYTRPGPNDPFARPDVPYAMNSEVHLTQSLDHHNGPGYETVNMNGMPSSTDSYGYPPQASAYNTGGMYGGPNNNSSMFLNKEGSNGGGQDFVGGWAPGTMIAQPLQQANYLPSYDPAGYENVRQRLMRKRTVKKIALTNGNLVLDVPVPRSICKANQAEEFRTMRYSAVTCDPNHWSVERFALRPFMMNRPTELAVCMTCYNEDEGLLFRTLGSVLRNVAYLQTRTRSKMWGENSWKKVVVFIVGDGRKKANERMLKMLSCYGIFQEGAMKDHVMDKEVTGHVFELTTQVIVDPQGGVQVSPCPVQLVFCLKEKNAKKINSHRWFFNAFCAQLQPNVTILLDVGTMPTDKSLYHLWKAFDKNSKVAGACGEIAVDTGKLGWRLYNPLVAAQNFEYKMSNILDKPLESVFGFIGVLPGAFSAYRWKALKGRPLEAYFKGEQLHNGELEGGSFVNNLYLAEDRILCFELVVKSNEPWILKYVKAAKATTDVPDGVAELIGQRRRWLNGSLFASMFALIHFGRIWSSGQSFLRKCLLQIQVIYNLVQMVFTWTSLANWYLASYFLMKSATSDPDHDPFAGQGKAVFDIVLNCYIALVVVVVVASLGSRPQGFRVMYIGCIVLFAALFALILYCVGWTLYVQLNQAHLFDTSGWTTKHILHLLVTSSNIRSIVISVIATYVLYILASLWMLDPWHMITSFVQYMFLTPFFITVLAIYSLANLHDVSWGTKGSDAASSDLGSVSGGAGKNKDGHTVVEVKVPTSATDADELWQHAQADLARKEKEQKQHRSKSVKQSDQQQNFRTQFLLFWLGTNAVLIIVFTSSFWEEYTRDELHLSTNPYLAVLFWSTAVLAAIRATGSLLYLVFRIFGH